MDICFSDKVSPLEVPEQTKMMEEVLFQHLTFGTETEGYQIACQPCWDYYQNLKRKVHADYHQFIKQRLNWI